MATIEALEASLRAAGVAYVARGSGKISAEGCVIIHVDVYGKVNIEAARSDADADRLERAFLYH